MGGVAAGALIGAAVGGVTSAITGGNVLQGMAMGGITGGIGSGISSAVGGMLGGEAAGLAGASVIAGEEAAAATLWSEAASDVLGELGDTVGWVAGSGADIAGSASFNILDATGALAEQAVSLNYGAPIIDYYTGELGAFAADMAGALPISVVSDSGLVPLTSIDVITHPIDYLGTDPNMFEPLVAGNAYQINQTPQGFEWGAFDPTASESGTPWVWSGEEMLTLPQANELDIQLSDGDGAITSAGVDMPDPPGWLDDPDYPRPIPEDSSWSVSDIFSDMSTSDMIRAGLGGAQLVNSLLGARAANRAGMMIRDAGRYAADAQMNMFAQTRADLLPYQALGLSGSNALTQLMGLEQGGQPLNSALLRPFGAGMDTAAQQAMLEGTPGYKFALSQGLRAGQNRLAAQGLGGSGAAVRGATDYATNLADTTYGEQFKRYWDQNTNIRNALGSIVAGGQSAAGMTGNLGYQAANAAGGYGVNAAAAAGAGGVGAVNAINQGIGGIGNLLFQNQLLNRAQGMYA